MEANLPWFLLPTQQTHVDPSLRMQRSDMEQFLYETTVAASVKEAVIQLAELHNLRAKIQVHPTYIIHVFSSPLSWPPLPLTKLLIRCCLPKFD